MDLYQELDRLTHPGCARSAIRSLSREEIEALQAKGEITPPALIPSKHLQGRVSVPERSMNNSDYLKRTRNRMRYV